MVGGIFLPVCGVGGINGAQLPGSPPNPWSRNVWGLPGGHKVKGKVDRDVPGVHVVLEGDVGLVIAMGQVRPTDITSLPSSAAQAPPHPTDPTCSQSPSTPQIVPMRHFAEGQRSPPPPPDMGQSWGVSRGCPTATPAPQRCPPALTCQPERRTGQLRLQVRPHSCPSMPWESQQWMGIGTRVEAWGRYRAGIWGAQTPASLPTPYFGVPHTWLAWARRKEKPGRWCTCRATP